MFYILNTVHMTIDINIAISGLVFRNRSFLCHLNTTGLASWDIPYRIHNQ